MMIWILLRHESRQWPEMPLSSKRLSRGENNQWPKAPLLAYALTDFILFSKALKLLAFLSMFPCPRIRQTHLD